jgi:dephospho-CoA kinase
MIIGLTGGIGSGKTAVSETFSRLGIDIVDADIVARDVVAIGTPALTTIVDKFGSDILLADGQLNRQKLRSLVFTNDDNKSWLNSLLHPLIRESMLCELKASTSPYCILVAPLLLENKLQKFVDRVLVVDVSIETQIDRTLTRDKSNRSEIEAIIASQISRADRLAAADDVINNDDITLIELKQQVEKLHQTYLSLS